MINKYTFILQIINFIVLFLVMRRLLFRPVKEFMEKRTQKIHRELDQARSERAEAAEIKRRYDEELKQVKHRASEIIDRAVRQGETLREEILNRARLEEEALKKRAFGEIEAEKHKALRELRGKIVGLSVAIAGKIIERSLRPEDHRRLVDEFIDKMGGERKWRKRSR